MISFLFKKLYVIEYPKLMKRRRVGGQPQDRPREPRPAVVEATVLPTIYGTRPLRLGEYLKVCEFSLAWSTPKCVVFLVAESLRRLMLYVQWRTRRLSNCGSKSCSAHHSVLVPLHSLCNGPPSLFQSAPSLSHTAIAHGATTPCQTRFVRQSRNPEVQLHRPDDSLAVGALLEETLVVPEMDPERCVPHSAGSLRFKPAFPTAVHAVRTVCHHAGRGTIACSLCGAWCSMHYPTSTYLLKLNRQ
jgi:hypothetical protein